MFYFGGAVRLIHGAVPYRDFITVQPPGVMLLMTPVAVLAGPLGTAKALAIGRVLTAFAGAGGVTLTGLLIRRHGVLAITAACGFLAVYPDGVYAAHTVLIEPWLVLFCLARALAVMDGDHLTSSWRRLAVGGAAFGFAGVCKAWAVIPVLVLLVLLLLPPGVRQAPWRVLVFLGGTVAGFALPVLPFAILAPHAFYNSVIVAQWSRTNNVRIPLSFRLSSSGSATRKEHHQLPSPASGDAFGKHLEDRVKQLAAEIAIGIGALDQCEQFVFIPSLVVPRIVWRRHSCPRTGSQIRTHHHRFVTFGMRGQECPRHTGVATACRTRRHNLLRQTHPAAHRESSADRDRHVESPAPVKRIRANHLWS